MYIYSFAFPTVLFPLKLIFNIYKSFYSFFLFNLFLSIFVSFGFIVLLPNWHLALALFSSFVLNFWFPLLTGSIYCTLFLLDCFDFAYKCIYMCVYIPLF